MNCRGACLNLSQQVEENIRYQRSSNSLILELSLNVISLLLMFTFRMADYFEEMNCTPLGEGETPNFLLHMARLLQDFGMWEELGTNKKLPPPASKQAVKDLKEDTVQEEGKLHKLVSLYISTPLTVKRKNQC